MAQQTNAIKDNSEAIGVTTQQYQEWLAAAKEAGVTQEQFTVAMRRFTNQVEEARTRSGEFYTFLRNSLPEFSQQLLATRSNGEAFEAMAQAVARLSTNEQRALLVKKAFGEEAWRMQQALQAGVTGLEEASRRARELGLILDQETIEQTRRMSTEIGRATDAIFAFGQRLIGVGATGFNQFLANLRRVTEEANKAAEATGNALNGRRPRERGPMPGQEMLRRWRELNGQMPPLELQPRPDTRGRDFVLSMAGQISQARGRALEVIQLEEIQAFNNLDKLRDQDAIDEARYQQARALIIQGTEVKRIELARGTERTLEGFRISALEASGKYYEAIKAQYEQDVRDLEVQLGRQLISQQQFETARANMAAVAAERTRLQRRADAENIAEQLSAYRSAVERAGSTISDGRVSGSSA